MADEKTVEVVSERFTVPPYLTGASRPVVTRNGILVNVAIHKDDDGAIRVTVRDFIRTYPEDEE
jgi:hypothetical protein